jgi:hypothetical protein
MQVDYPRILPKPGVMEIDVERSPTPSTNSLPASVLEAPVRVSGCRTRPGLPRSPWHSRTLDLQAQTTWSTQSACQKQTRMKCSYLRCQCPCFLSTCPCSQCQCVCPCPCPMSFVSSRFQFHSFRHGLLYISIYLFFVLFSHPSVLVLPREVYVLSQEINGFLYTKDTPPSPRSRPFQKSCLLLIAIGHHCEKPFPNG